MSGNDTHPNLDKVIAEYLKAVEAGNAPDRDELVAQHSDLADDLKSFFADHDAMQQATDGASELRILPPGEPSEDATLPLPDSDSAAGHDAAEAPGTKVRYFGDYELLEEIARGGMGIVYKARQVSLNRIVAVKMILSGQLASDEDVKRFRGEAEAAANLQHPGIVSIYEVGQHEGQHYFSMDYVEGQSLAETLRGGPLEATAAARYVQAAAEAIHDAHSQGTLHRDLKPSNILIDRSDRVRITDFGLAKRVAADSALTATGQVLGTPSYMPPEQATGRKQASAAGDVYALGAVLYELLTDRPPFRAETPLETLKQVVEHEPAMPRLLNPNVPRDLETVCLKCLQKDPRDRYRSAQKLADDLGRFLDGEPIRARRIGAVERAGRWLWKRRRIAVWTAGTALLAAALVVGGRYGLRAHQKLREGFVTFDTAGPSLVTEVFDESGELVQPSFTTPTLQPVALREGSYRVRFSAPRQLSEESLLLVERGYTHEFQVELEDRQLWPPLDLSGRPEVIRLADTDDVIVVTESGSQRRSGRTGEVIWTTDFPDGHPGLAAGGIRSWRFWTNHNIAKIVRPAPDLNGDGAGDLIWRGSAPPSLVAVSGADGELLWAHTSREETTNADDGIRDNVSPEIAGQMVGQPAVADVDGDGGLDLILTFGRSGSTPVETGGEGAKDYHVSRNYRDAERWVEAVSGRSGATLWDYTIDPQHYQGPFSWTPSDATAHAAAVNRFGDKQCAVVAAGRALITIDAATGKADPILHSFPYPIEQWQLADLNGDSQHETLLLVRDASSERTLTAVSPIDPKPLWRCQLEYVSVFPSWIVMDVGNGQTDVFLTGSIRETIGGRADTHYAIVRCVNGRSGKVRWEEKWLVSPPDTFDLQKTQAFTGPDIDGDGVRDLCVATKGKCERYESIPSRAIAIDALSGKDGKILWHWDAEVEVSFDPLWQIKGVHARQCGLNGLPTLMVQCGLTWPGEHTASAGDSLKNLESRLPHPTFLLEAGSGRTLHTLTDVADPMLGDLNGDGIADLSWFDVNTRGSETYGTLHALRGKSAVVWRRLGGLWLPTRDLNGDGVRDFLGIYPYLANVPNRPNRFLAAMSGSNGQLLWRRMITIWEKSITIDGALAGVGDLSGDAVADVVLHHGKDKRALSALSGKDGRTLWTVSPPDEFSRPTFLHGDDLNGDGQPEVVVGYFKGIVVFAGRTGELIWKKGISHWAYLDGVHDLDNDGTRDPLIRAHRAAEDLGRESREYRALSGADGKLLWQRTLREGSQRKTDDWEPLPVGDVTGDGRPEIVVVDDRVEALNAAAGQTKWTWKWPGRPSRGHVRYNVSAVTLADFEGSGRASVCLAVGDQIVVLDGAGQLREQTPLHAPTGYWSTSKRYMRLVNFDVDGDGKDELLIAWGYQAIVARDGQRHTVDHLFASLRVLDDDVKRVLWEWPFPYGHGELLEIRPASETAHVVVRTGNKLFALDCRSGRVMWQTEVPAVSEGYSSRFDLGPTVLATQGGDDPLVAFHDETPQTTRQTVYDTPPLFFSGQKLPTYTTICRSPAITVTSGMYDAYRAEPPEPDVTVHNLSIVARLAADFPHTHYHQVAVDGFLDRCWKLAEANDGQAARSNWKQVVILWRAASERFRGREQWLRESLSRYPESAEASESLAWFLATCPDRDFRRPAEAVQIAQRALELSQESSNGWWGYWNALGVAHYRNEAYDEALKALEKSAELGSDGDSPFNTFFMAMAKWQLGGHGAAAELYHRAVSQIEQTEPADEARLRRSLGAPPSAGNLLDRLGWRSPRKQAELRRFRRFRAEAALLLATEPLSPTP